MSPFRVFKNKTATVLAISFLGKSAKALTPSHFRSQISSSTTTSFIHHHPLSILTVPAPSTHFAFPTLRQSSSSLLFSSTSESSMTKKRVLVPISDGSEEIETCCITDTLTRFGADVVIASVKPNGELKCTMSRGIQVLADISIDEAINDDWDLIALPGGMPGAEHLRDSKSLHTILMKQKESNKKYAAVCASPAVVLASKDLLPEMGGSTCYPADGFRSVLENPSNDSVVTQGNVVTSQGPGTSLKFALQLGEELFGKDAAEKIAKEMLVER